MRIENRVFLCIRFVQWLRMGFAEKWRQTDYKNDVEKQVNYYYGINSDGYLLVPVSIYDPGSVS
ncbi:hypothetical protein NXW78_02020 [Bacteroides ovatus]|nr:hypothetical protein [Bacteroides ovatus]